MRRILVLVVLLGAMLGIKLLQSQDQISLMLAAIGFVLLASFTVAEMGSAVTLPRVTGYILSGSLLATFGILSPAVVLEMKMFNTLALGLIAVSAGLELSLEQLKRVYRTLFSTVVAKLLIPAPLVGLAFYFFESTFSPLGIGDSTKISAVALIMGALALGTSPAIALAIMTETRAKGRLSDIVLGAAVLKDLVVVVTLAVAVAVAGGLVASGAQAGGGLHHVFVELGLSLLAGGVLGVLMILYIRYIKAEMLLFVAAMILVVAEVSKLLHLELLLVFIAGGFVVRNFSKYEHDLLHPVQLVSLPVFVVFFTIAGASIDLQKTWAILPLALTLCGVRALGYRFAAGLGNAFGKEPEAVRANAWLGYLPQAGVTLGLVGLAASQLPLIAEEIRTTGMAVVAVNLLLGPVALRVALKRAGEIAGTAVEEEAKSSEEEAPDEENLIETLPAPLRPAMLRMRYKFSRLENERSREFDSYASELADAYADLAQAVQLDVETGDTQWKQTRPRAEQLTRLSASDREGYMQARGLVRSFPEIVEVPLEASNQQVQSNDTLRVAWSKRLYKFGRLLSFRRNPVRKVPLRELARLHFEPRLAELAARKWTSRMRLHADVLDDLSALAYGDLTPAQFDKRLSERIDSWKNDLLTDERSVFSRAVGAARKQLLIVDTPYLGRNKVRASAANNEIFAALAQLENAPEWLQVLDAGWGRVFGLMQARTLRQQLTDSLRRELIEPGRNGSKGISLVLRGWEEAMQDLLSSAKDSSVPLADALHQFEEADLKIRTQGSDDLEKATARYRAALNLRAFAHVVRSEVDTLSAELVLSRSDTVLSRVQTPAEIELRKFEFRKHAERHLAREAVADIEELEEDAESLPRKTARAVLNLLESARIELRPLTEDPDQEAARTKLIAVLQRVLTGIEGEKSLLLSTQADLGNAMSETLRKQLDEIVRLLDRDGLSLRKLVGAGGWFGLETRLQGYLRGSLDKSSRVLRSGLRLARSALGSELTLDVQAKYKEGELDVAAVRESLARQSSTQDLGGYAEHFELVPLREPSHFVAHRKVLRTMLDAERKWLQGGASSILLVGDAGSGRTSLLNLVQHGSLTQTLVRPNPMEWRRNVGLLQALSYELGCRPRPGNIERALQSQETVIVVDDLEQWIPPGLEGLAQLETLLELITKTREKTFWVVAAGSAWFDMAQTVTDVSSSFGKLLQLGPVSSDEIREAIERRHESSMNGLVYPSTLIGRIIGKGRVHRDRDLFFQVLSRAAGGNLSRSLSLWTQAAHREKDGAIHPQLSRAISLGLPFFHRLSSLQLAILNLLMRVGPLTPQELAQELATPLPLTSRQLSFLLSSELLQVDPSRAPLVRIPREWAPLVQVALREVRAL